MFEKYKNTFKPPQSSVEKEFIVVVRQVVGVSINIDQVTYSPSSRTISLHLPSVLKSEIVRKKADVISTLSSSLGASNAPTEVI